MDAPSSAALAALLPRAVTWEPLVSSWVEGRFLASVPVAGGSVAWSSGREVPGSLDLTVPREAWGRDWRPGLDADHPLAAKGQQLHVSVRVGAPASGQSWTIRLGTFLIARSEASAGVVRVTGLSMMERVVRDRLTSPMAPRSGGTLASELRRLVPASMGLTISGDLTDRACPAMSWGESRADAIAEIAAAWPCRIREDAYGALHALPPLGGVPDPLDTLTDGEGGTVVEAYEADDAAGVYNRVVARGQESSDAGLPTIQAVASQETGPYAVARFGAKTFFLSSPLLTSMSAAESAARTRLAGLLRPARTVPVTIAPDPRWEVDDAVEVLADGSRWWGWVSGVQVPLTVADGDMRLDVEVA